MAGREVTAKQILEVNFPELKKDLSPEIKKPDEIPG